MNCKRTNIQRYKYMLITNNLYLQSTVKISKCLSILFTKFLWSDMTIKCYSICLIMVNSHEFKMSPKVLNCVALILITIKVIYFSFNDHIVIGYISIIHLWNELKIICKTLQTHTETDTFYLTHSSFTLTFAH